MSILLAMGLDNIVTGSIAYLGVKVVGYTAAAYFLNRVLVQTQSIFLVGFVRTLIGVLIGSAYFSIFILTESEPGTLWFLLPLVVVRYFEWWIIFKMFYRRKKEFEPGDHLGIVLLIIYSFFLDLPTIFGLFATGAFWVC